MKGIKSIYIPLIFTVTLLFIIGNILFSFQLINSIHDNENLVDHTYSVISTLQNTIFVVTQTENLQKNYIILHQDSDLTLYKNSLSLVYKQLSQLTNLTQDNQTQQKNISLLKQKINAWIAS